MNKAGRGRNAHERWSRFDYAPCWWCGQRVAHTKAGEVLHVHARSVKCRVQASERAQLFAALVRAGD
jgi:hypothetical protein